MNLNMSFVPAPIPARASADCADQVCVAGAIANYSTRATSDQLDVANEAVKFLTHLVGDMAQVTRRSLYFAFVGFIEHVSSVQPN